MRILVLTSRFPEAGGKGDQIRALPFVRHLARRHEVTVLSTGSPSSAAALTDLEQIATVVLAPVERTLRALSAAGAVARGAPAQVGWMTPRRAWRVTRDLAARHDVVLAMTVRTLRGPLPAPVVLDHVDALSLNMERRARGPEAFPVRAAAAADGFLLRRHERLAATWSAAQVATAAEDAARLPADPPVLVLPQGWDGPMWEEPPGHLRDIDVIFTGYMRYPPNRAAAEWLARDILPRVRRRHPDVNAWIVGRAADTLDVAGVNVASDVPDLLGYLRRAKIAVLPLREGTGTPNKAIEAAASGTALVSTPWVVERFGLPAATAEDAEGLARGVGEYLDDETARRAAVARIHDVLQTLDWARLVARLEGALERAGSESARRERSHG